MIPDWHELAPVPMRAHNLRGYGLSALGGALLLVLIAGAGCVSGHATRYAIDDEVVSPDVPLVRLCDSHAGVTAWVAPTKGAELAGLGIELDGHFVELLYRARDYSPIASWQGRAPILWPAVGRSVASSPVSTQADAYLWNGVIYGMPQHGFARLKRWTEVMRAATDASATLELELRDDAVTRENYPFGFVHRVTYRLENGVVTITHTITASPGNDQSMFFAIGNHASFRVPLAPGSSAARCSLEFSPREEFVRDSPGLPTGQLRQLAFTGPIALSSFDSSQARWLGGTGSLAWAQLTDEGGVSIRISHLAARMPVGNVVQFSIWGDPARDGYICVEPWLAVPNGFNSRQGLVEVAPGESWSWAVVFEPRKSGPQKPD